MGFRNSSPEALSKAGVPGLELEAILLLLAGLLLSILLADDSRQEEGVAGLMPEAGLIPAGILPTPSPISSVRFGRAVSPPLPLRLTLPLRPAHRVRADHGIPAASPFGGAAATRLEEEEECRWRGGTAVEPDSIEDGERRSPG